MRKMISKSIWTQINMNTNQYEHKSIWTQINMNINQYEHSNINKTINNRKNINSAKSLTFLILAIMPGKIISFSLVWLFFAILLNNFIIGSLLDKLSDFPKSSIRLFMFDSHPKFLILPGMSTWFGANRIDGSNWVDLGHWFEQLTVKLF